MRLIVGAPYRAHTEPIFKELGIRPLHKEISYKQALLAYEIVKDIGHYNVHLQTEHQHMHNTRFTENRLPITRKRTKRYGTCGIEYTLIKSFNELPMNIRNSNINNPVHIKRMISQYFDTP